MHKIGIPITFRKAFFAVQQKPAMQKKRVIWHGRRPIA
jgi:hypothetical protein